MIVAAVCLLLRFDLPMSRTAAPEKLPQRHTQAHHAQHQGVEPLLRLGIHARPHCHSDAFKKKELVLGPSTMPTKTCSLHADKH